MEEENITDELVKLRNRVKKQVEEIEILQDALLDGYHDFSEQQLTHNRRSLTETEMADI